MESLILEIKRTVLQQIPNGLTLIFAIGSLTACFFILLKRRHHGRFYLCFRLLILFMFLWRVIVGIVATRYTALLVIPAVILTAFTALRLEIFWKLLRRKFPFLPRWFGKAAPRIFLICITAGSLFMARHALSSQQDTYRQLYGFISEYRSRYPDVTVMLYMDQAIPCQYYTGANVAAYPIDTIESVITTLHHPLVRGKHMLIVIRSSKRKAPVFESSLLPPGAEVKLLHAEQRKKKRKSVFIYRCTWNKNAVSSQNRQHFNNQTASQ